MLSRITFFVDMPQIWILYQGEDKLFTYPIMLLMTSKDKYSFFYSWKFYECVNNWFTFWNRFESAIHNNEKFDKVDKFNLKANLGGYALQTIEGLHISASTYDAAIKLLKERFARSDLLIHFRKQTSTRTTSDQGKEKCVAFSNLIHTICKKVQKLTTME
jgi:hypothetical protein